MKDQMTYQDFLKLCQEKNLLDLVEYRQTPTLDMSSKIVASAIIDQFPTLAASPYGLTSFDDKLSPEAVPAFISLISENVDLVDFAKAYRIATSGLNPTTPGLNNPELGEIIKAYVYAHQDELTPILADECMSDEIRSDIMSIFDDIGNNFEDNLLLQVLLEQMHEELTDVLVKIDEQKFKDLLGYSPRELTLNKAIMGLALDLQFKNNPSKKVLEEYAEMLKSIGVQANAYCDHKSNGKERGIMIIEDALEVAEKLETFSKASPSKNGLFAKANAHLARANELREKSVSDIELANSDFGKAVAANMRRR